MFMYFLITFIFLAIVIIDFRIKGFIKKKHWKDAIAYIIIFSITLLYSYGTFGNLELPSPNGLIEIVFKPISYYFYGEPIK